MKKYSRELRKWVTLEEYEAAHNKKKLCVGKRKEHEFVQVLPSHYRMIDGGLGMDVADKVLHLELEIQNKIAEAELDFKNKLTELGVEEKYMRYWGRARAIEKNFICIHCKKLKHTWLDTSMA